MTEHETIELPGALTLTGADIKDTRLISIEDDGIKYTKIDGLNPKDIGLLVFSNDNEARDLIAKWQGQNGGVRIVEHLATGQHKVVSTYADIENPQAIFLHTLDGAKPKQFAVRLQPEVGDFAFGTTRIKPNSNDLIREHNYSTLEVTEIDLTKTKAVVRIGKTLN